MRFALLFIAMLPNSVAQSMAAAALMVAAFTASSGKRRCCMQARDKFNSGLMDGDEPGLKSLAMAIPIPLSIIALAGA